METRQPSANIIQQVADHHNTDPQALDTLYPTTDPDAIDTLVQLHDDPFSLSFRYAGLTVTINHEGDVDIDDPNTH